MMEGGNRTPSGSGAGGSQRPSTQQEAAAGRSLDTRFSSGPLSIPRPRSRDFDESLEDKVRRKERQRSDEDDEFDEGELAGSAAGEDLRGGTRLSRLVIQRRPNASAASPDDEEELGGGDEGAYGRWLEVEVPEGVLNLGSVVLRDVHVLRRFEVVNRSARTLEVELGSSLPEEQLGFQLTNENLQLDEEDHNQLFNTINRIRSLVLAPRERQTIILAFLPATDLTPHHEGEEEEADNRTSYSVKGEITLTARPQGGRSSQSTVVTLLAKVCKLEMKVDATELVFDNCLVGGSYVKDFTIRNYSEIPLMFTIKTDSIHHGPSSKEKVLEFVDYDTGATVRDHMIPSFAHITIRATYRPAEVGNFSYVVRIENIKDPNSVHFISVKSSVVSELRPKSILLSVAKLDFGDCYTSVPVYQVLTVKNVTENPMEVFFDSDASHEVTFDLITDNDHKSEKLCTPSDEAESDSESESDVESTQSSPKALDDDEELSTSLETMLASGVKAAAKAARHSRIEEISLGPGAEKTIKIWYCPEPDENLPSSTIIPGSETVNRLATLARRSFQITLTCKNREGQVNTRKTVSGTAKVCTSFIYAPRTEINLGDCDIGSWRSAVVELLNLSDLPAKVVVNYQSKVVTFRQQHITIPPHQSADLKLDFVPRKINHDYRKEITFVNSNNKNNDLFVEVRANNIDPLRITYHSVFYHLITPHSHNYLDFENVIVGSPAVRTFLIRNVSGNDLKLEFKTSLADEITLCKQGASSFLSQSPLSKTEQLMQRIEENEGRTQIFSRSSDADAQTASYLDLANVRNDVSPAKRTSSKTDLLKMRAKDQTPSQGALLLAESERERERRKLIESGDVIPTFTDDLSGIRSGPQTPLSSSPSNDLISLTRRLSYTGTLPENMTPASEEHYIISQEKRFKGVMRALNEGLLIPLTGKSLHLLPDEECVVYVVFRPSPTKRGWLQGKLKKIKGSISIRLVDYDVATLRQVADTSENVIPPRDLLVTANICRSIMELAQKNINFGTVFKNTKQQQKTLVINNLSEVPLVYRVKKSGSIASLDLIISKPDRMGIIRPYRRKELHFLFKPTITGPFNEKLVIENIHDTSNNQVITVKAVVKPNVTFFVRSMSIDFGAAVLGMKSKRCQIIVSNTTNHKRQYEIKVDEDSAAACDYDILLRLEKTAPIVLTKEEEVQVAHLLQRIKIARRKGQEEKISKYMEQLNKLQAGKMQKESPGSSNVASGYSSDVDDSEDRKERVKRADTAYSVQKNALSLNIDGGGACSILAVLRPRALRRAPRDVTRGLPLEGRLLIYETKNVDVVKHIAWRATVCATNEDYLKLALTDPTMTSGSRSSDDLRELLAAEMSQASGSPLKEGAITPPNSPIASSPLDYFSQARVQRERIVSASSPLKSSENVANAQELEISPMAINFGAVKLGKSVSSKFTMRNPTDEDITYAIFETDERHSDKKGDAVVSVKEEGGLLKARATKDVVFSITPHDTGRHTYYIAVMNMKTMNPRTVSVTLSVEKARGLRYPDLATGGQHHSVIDLGLCYIDGARNEYAKVHPFRIQNMSSTALVLAAQSNMPSQVFLFQDTELTQPAVGILLPPRKMTTIYICLQPNKKHLNKIYSDGTCRDIVGGIRIKAVEADSSQGKSTEALLSEEKSMVPTFEETIKFTAILGKSVMSVSEHAINLGTVTALGSAVIKGHFEVSNQSTRLPLEWFIPTPKLFNLSRLRGHLKPRGSEDSTQRIEVSLVPKHYGYFEEEIKIYNTHSRDPALRVHVSLFARENLVHLVAAEDGSTSEQFSTEPTLNFACTYLRPRELDANVSAVSLTSANERGAKSEQPSDNEEENDDLEAEIESETSSDAGSDVPELELNMDEHSGSRWKNVYLENVTDSDLFLSARGELDMDIRWQREDSHALADQAEFVLKSGQKATLLLGVPLPTQRTLKHATSRATTTQNLINYLLEGQRVDVQGHVFIERHRNKHGASHTRERDHVQCCQIIRINTSYAVSMGRLTPQEIKLETISDVWKPIPFDFTLQNLSNAPLVCQIEKLPVEVTIISPIPQPSNGERAEKRPDEVTNPHLNSIITVPPSSSLTVMAVLNPSEINYPLQNNYENSITLVNVNNSTASSMVLPLRASVSLYHLKYLGLSGDGDLLLPTLTHPAPPNSPPVDEWFTVQNTSGRSLDIEIQGQLNLPMADLIALYVLSRESNLPITKITLGAGESFEIKVRVEARKDTRVPPHLGKKYKDYPLGKLHLRSEHVAETIFIHGSIEPGPTFSLSTTRLHFRSDVSVGSSEPSTETQGQTIRIKNLLSQFPLQLNLVEQLASANRPSPREVSDVKASPRVKDSELQSSGSELPISFQILDIQPDKVNIPPGESIDVSVTLRERAKISSNSISEERAIIITDTRAPSMPQSIAVTHSRLEGHKSVSGRQGVELDVRSLALNKKEEPTVLSPIPRFSAPRLALRGCTPIVAGHADADAEELSYRYEINLGQHTHGSGPVNWTLTLESVGNDPQASLEYKIYSLKENDKTWMTIGRNRGILSGAGEHQQVMLTFSTDRVDFYTTYLLIQNLDNPHDLKTIRINHEVVSQERVLFGVLVDGKEADNPVIDLGDVYYGQVYRDHSFIILNQSDMALDFLLTDAASREDRVEVGFSLSQTTLKIFNALNIEPRKSVRVFVHFQAQLPGDLPADLDTPLDKTIDINVNCRLVKDHKLTIQLRARLRPSSLQLSNFNLAFRGRINVASGLTIGSDAVVSVDMPDEAKEFNIHNPSTEPIRYRIMNDSLFFSVSKSEGEVDAGQSIPIEVRPNMIAIYQNRRLFLKEKYIEEHLTVYRITPQRYTERSYVATRLMFGHLPSDVFYTSPGAKNAYPFLTLEERIVRFMRDLNLYFTSPGQERLFLAGDESSTQEKQSNPLAMALINISSHPEPERQQWLEQMSFQLHFLTDQLGFYGLKKQTGGNALRLAHLLFSGLQKQYDVSALIHKWSKAKHQQPSGAQVRKGSKVLLQMINLWAARLGYFVGLFPESSQDLELLRALRLQLQNQSGQLHAFLHAESVSGSESSAALRKETDDLPSSSSALQAED